MTLQNDQAPIDRRIASALIAATPANWDTADLSVKREEVDGIERLSIEISNSRGLRDNIVTTDELTDAIYALCDCFKAHGPVWREAHYVVSLSKSEEWNFEATFNY